MSWKIVLTLAVVNCWTSVVTAIISPRESDGSIFIGNMFPFSEIIEKFPTCMVHIIELTDGLQYLDSASVPVVLHRAGNWNDLNATERVTAGQGMRALSTVRPAMWIASSLLQ